ncbi:MAG: HD domain-containing protein [Butyrivibrio sp.]|nr:HD domain-containing protein [Butyrivibrio sp.]
MKYIETFREGERISGIYFCKHKTIAVAKSGKEYGSIVLQDKTGKIDGKIWDLGSAGIREFDSLDYIEIKGDVTIFNNAPQLNIKEVRRADAGTYSEGDYLPTSAYDTEEMYAELMGYINKLTNPYLSALANKFFEENTDFIKKFKRHSAAKSVHHGFVGGLLEHTLGVTRLCCVLADNYKFLNRDLLVTAAVFHDIGKVYEISEFPENDYTDSGQLLGHIVMGSELIGNAIRTIDGFPASLARELKHCILAHHGEFEFGSPKKPALIEALALHYADDLDAKLETFKEALDAPGIQAGEWLGFNRMLDSNIRKTIG